MEKFIVQTLQSDGRWLPAGNWSAESEANWLASELERDGCTVRVYQMQPRDDRFIDACEAEEFRRCGIV